MPFKKGEIKQYSFVLLMGEFFGFCCLFPTKRGEIIFGIFRRILTKRILRPDLISELKVQNLTNLTRPSCAYVRGGEN
jgi:hypothetical protein